MKIIYTENQKLGNLIFLRDLKSFSGKNGRKTRMALFLCSCGASFGARIEKVKSYHTKSCGCTKAISISQKNSTHGLSNSPLFIVWQNMKARCYNKNHPRFKDWGARGISVCEEWKNDFMSFYNWALNNGYSSLLSIDRKENDGNYTPLNCRWVNKSIQSQNTRILMSTNTTGFRGVHLNKYGKYRATIHIDGKNKHLGYFSSDVEAAIAYNNYVIVNKLNNTINKIGV